MSRDSIEPTLDVALITSAKYGLTQFIFRDIEALLARGHRVRLYTIFNEPGLYEPLPDWDVTEVSKAKALRALASLCFKRPALAFRLMRHAAEHRVMRDLAIAAQWAPSVEHADVIFSYFGDHKLYVGYYAKLITGRPLAVTIRAYELYRNPRPRLFEEALAACDRVLTITDYNKGQLVERFGVDESRIEIVRQIVNLDQHRDRAVTTILSVGFFAEKKGYDVLLRAFKQLDRDDVELWIAGDATPSVLRVDVRQMASDLGITDRVAFFGAQSGVALRALYREADVFCLASRTDRLGDKEGFPNVVAEAMAFSKPIVSTIHAAIPEAVDEILVPEDDVDALANALRTVLDSRSRWDAMGAANRAKAEEMFSPRNNEDLAAALGRAAGVRDAADSEDSGLDESAGAVGGGRALDT